MHYFIILFLILLFLIFLFYGLTNLKKRDKHFLNCIFLIFFIFHAFKDPFCTVDNDTYYEVFLIIDNISWKQLFSSGFRIPGEKMECGYIFLNKLVSTIFGRHPQMIFVTTSFIILLGYYVTFRRNPVYVWIAVLLFLVGPFNQSIFVLRQHMAMSICLFAYPYITKRKFIPFLLISLVAFSFHRTSAVLFMLYFVYSYINNRGTLIGMIGATIALSFTITMLFERLFIDSVYAGYIVSSEVGQNAKVALLLCAILIYRMIAMKDVFFADGINKLFSTILILGVMFSIVSIGVSVGGVGRLFMYYTSCTYLIIPNTLQYDKSRIRRLLVIIILIPVLCYFYFANLSNYFLNYRFIWNI